MNVIVIRIINGNGKELSDSRDLRYTLDAGFTVVWYSYCSGGRLTYAPRAAVMQR